MLLVVIDGQHCEWRFVVQNTVKAVRYLTAQQVIRPDGFPV